MCAKFSVTAIYPPAIIRWADATAQCQTVSDALQRGAGNKMPGREAGTPFSARRIACCFCCRYSLCVFVTPPSGVLSRIHHFLYLRRVLAHNLSLPSFFDFLRFRLALLSLSSAFSLSVYQQKNVFSVMRRLV